MLKKSCNHVLWYGTNFVRTISAVVKDVLRVSNLNFERFTEKVYTRVSVWSIYSLNDPVTHTIKIMLRYIHSTP